jgi:hypothetical protein
LVKLLTKVNAVSEPSVATAIVPASTLSLQAAASVSTTNKAKSSLFNVESHVGSHASTQELIVTDVVVTEVIIGSE